MLDKKCAQQSLTQSDCTASLHNSSTQPIASTTNGDIDDLLDLGKFEEGDFIPTCYRSACPRQAGNQQIEKYRDLLKDKCTIKIYGERLHSCREQMGMTQKEVAVPAGITFQQLSNIEKGEPAKIQLPLLMKFAPVLRVTPYYLLGLTNERAGVPATEHFIQQGCDPGKEYMEPVTFNLPRDPALFDRLKASADMDPDLCEAVYTFLINKSSDNKKFDGVRSSIIQLLRSCHKM